MHPHLLSKLLPSSGYPFVIGRRAIVQMGLGGLATAGMPLGGLASPNATLTGPRAKRMILLFMWGGPSHLDTLDLKPTAPREIRGPFRPISTSAPEIEICEHFPHLAMQAHHLAIVRSLTHDDPAHLSSAHTLLTGHLPPVNKSDAQPPSENDSPHIGSMLDRLRSSSQSLLPFVSLPWTVSHPAAPGGVAPGQNGGWLGRRYDPFAVTGDPNAPGWGVPALAHSASQSSDRFGRRRNLLKALDSQQYASGLRPVLPDVESSQDKALDMLTSSEVRRGFQLDEEPAAVREKYGRSTHGQAVLLARRLIEHGVSTVTVNWHNDGENFWDTHGNNFQKLQQSLIPQADRALAALLGDLHDRGLLDETLVMWVGEFGRSPRITGGPDGTGREHHPFCYSGLMAGGGVRGGQVFGKSDRQGARPIERPVSPHDFMSTALFAHGIPADAALPDQLGRPRPVYAGKPLIDLF